MVFVLFLVSVAVTELILRHDRKGQERSPFGSPVSAADAKAAQETSEAATEDLLALADAVPGETPAAPEYNREHVRVD